MQTGTISILLVDDHAMFREGLLRTFEREPRFSVIGQCSTVAEGVGFLDQNPDLVLLDVDLGRERAFDFIAAAKKVRYGGKILILTAGISGNEALHLIESGIAGILHKSHSSEVLCETILKAIAGESCLEQPYLNSLFQRIDRSNAGARPTLTDRDRTVLRYVLQGLTNREIGEQIEISEGAVKASLRVLFEKLGVRTRAQLVKVALEQYRHEL